MGSTPEEQEAQAQAEAIQEESLQTRMMKGHSLEDAFNQLCASERAQFGQYPGVLNMRLAALEAARKKIVERLAAVSYWRKAAIKCGRPDWYGGPGDEASIWEALKRRLVSQGRNEAEIEGVDSDSTAVVSLLDNPGLSTFSTRGLVIGHVQSGKTGNMAAVVAKAADTPYKFFVVLSGMTDSLRNQTQSRLDADLVDNGYSDRWFRWTHIDRVMDNGVLEKGDFKHPPRGGFLLDGAKNHLAVMKKNASVLRRFRDKLRSTPRVVLEQTPFVIIDDECDQASVNSSALRTAISTINKLIREIVELLPRVAYVGYTATPFANVLINPSETEDLYPRDFIYPLARPAAYFGAVELFGREALDGEDSEKESGYDMIRIVPETEADYLRPKGRKAAGFEFEVTDSLNRAICYFIMAIAAREARGQVNEHSTMLIHTSMLNSVHQSAKNAITPLLAHLSEGIAGRTPSLLATFERIWNEESRRVDSDEFGLEAVPFAELLPRLQSVVASIDVKVENWTSQDRIDYSEPARRYLVIGGNVLARGLTLNGLIVSFFMRSSSQYDTLMQMGRWFGYRPGFGDLPRVWMETAVRDAFFDLATVEEEIRRDAARYAEDNLTPEQFAVRIRKIPGLAITARAKMRDAKVAQVGYEGEHLQTIRFRRHDRDWLNRNWDIGSRLVDASGEWAQVGPNFIRKSVDVRFIQEFLRDYEIEGGRSMRSELMLGYIDKVGRDNSSLARWDILIVGNEEGRRSDRPLGAIGRVKCVNRSPLRNSGDFAFIKALMSRRDLLADFDVQPMGASRMSWDAIKTARENARMPPLMVLYPIDRYSIPSSGLREPMEASADLLGLGIVFSGKPGSGVEYVQAAIQPEDADADEEFVGVDALPGELVDDAR